MILENRIIRDNNVIRSITNLNLLHNPKLDLNSKKERHHDPRVRY